jgi:hypothetical protein
MTLAYILKILWLFGCFPTAFLIRMRLEVLLTWINAATFDEELLFKK